MSWIDFLHTTLGTNWVLHPRTKRIVERYGESVVCVSRQRWNKLKAEYCETMNCRAPYEPRISS